MSGYRILYRILGGFWIFLGVLILGVSLGYILSMSVMDNFMKNDLPEVAAILGPLLRAYSPTLQHISGLLFSAFCLVMGSGMITSQNWARTVGVAFHMVMGICLLALMVTFYVAMNQLGSTMSKIPELARNLLLILGVLFAIGLIVVGYLFSTDDAMRAFAKVAVPSAAGVKVLCPTCNEPMDLARGLCPRCDFGDGIPVVPIRAHLIDAISGKDHLVSTRLITHIGREQQGYEIQLTDPSVSHEHAWIEFANGLFFLHADNDTNGTFVNDMNVRIRDTEVKNGDLISFGKAQFRFKVDID